MSRDFFNAEQAAVELTRSAPGQPAWTVRDVLMQARAERLPVCFEFTGEMILYSVDGILEPAGVEPRLIDFSGVVRSLAAPASEGVCQDLMSVEVLEAYGVKYSHRDGRISRGIKLPTEFDHGGKIESGHVVRGFLEDVNIPVAEFLFHVDDLAELIHLKSRSQDYTRGTPPVLTREKIEQVVRGYNFGQGDSVARLARNFKTSRRTIDKALGEAGVKNVTPRKPRSPK